ncbi:hypothetical protein EDB19DRAFT_1900504 [Suillus lakei]|nr:hypothetical protein EDB19DRAFT_1900504 [Suillus lakei]
MKLKLKGYKSEQPIHPIWRDGLEVMKQLFANPIYVKHMCYDTHHIYQGQEHQIGEFWTSDDAWEIQDQLLEGATVVPIIAASDKTPVTRHTGGLEMHPSFLTIRNIQANVHMKAMSHVWRCTAFMPILTFIVNSDFQTLLWVHLWHKCMDLVCCVGEYMVDPLAKICCCFTPLISHIAVLPEQLMITCIMKNLSPVTTATHKEFGDETPHPPRNESDTYALIQQLCNRSKKLHLSGVHLPYWRNWRCSNPTRFLTPEILHTLHKFFFNHILKWIKQIMGHELDVWFKSHHKHTGVHHFSGGVSHHRDIQRTIVLTLWGITSPGFIRVVQAMIDFIYLAQNPLHTESSIASMTQALQDFHDNKQAILDAEACQGKSGAKDDFFIPKLELMQNFTHAISHVDSLMQWTADISEHLLITHCKHPFEHTSHQRDFDPLMNAVIMEDEEIASMETDPTFAWVSNANPAAQLCLQVLCPVRNHFLKGSCQATFQ